ncbi:ATP-dependent DNA helicase [Methylophilaceae bacterium]|jgi:ATP-dependent DNA helicase DinG|nr:ATP-dependent DNA helicase [Methylophilaceae bacterium]
MKNDLIIDEIFSDDGALSEVILDYRKRSEQLDMSKAVNETIQLKNSLIVEAGTGVGKTFSYLVPALINGGKVVISTATKNLQDQLFLKDIPTIRDALKIPVKINILKGRANYICQLRMENSLIEGKFFNKEDASFINKIKTFSDHSNTGEVSEIHDIPENSTIWPSVTSTKENCLGQNCDFAKSCFLIKARKEALAAEVLIVNHHLFFADFILKDEDISEILPAADTVIFDEAHQIPDVGSIFFGDNFSTIQILILIQDIQLSFKNIAKNLEELDIICKNILIFIVELRDYLDSRNNRISYNKIPNKQEFTQKLEEVIDEVVKLNNFIDLHRDQSAEMMKLSERIKSLVNITQIWRASDSNDYVYWLDIFAKSIQFNITPISISSQFKKLQDQTKASWIFTSATLAVNDSFEHFQTIMGLEEAKTLQLKSPFNYNENACLYVPNDMPEPNTEIFNLALIKKVFPLIIAAKGRTFILSTSIKSMNEITSFLKEEFEKENIIFPILTQGMAPKNMLLDQFKSHGNAVLVGSLSFWEGVDVRGSALSLVIIDKLPFQSPGDPVFESKINMLKTKGGNPFMSLQLPQAIINLKQGAGRLIRDELDKGVLMICDLRIINKPYGKKIWKSLPAFKRTRDENEAIDFLKRL